MFNGNFPCFVLLSITETMSKVQGLTLESIIKEIIEFYLDILIKQIYHSNKIDQKEITCSICYLDLNQILITLVNNSTNII